MDGAKVMKSKFIYILPLLIACLLNPGYAGTKLQRFYAKTGLYLGLSVPQNTFKTNYDRKTIQIGENELLMPETQKHNGFGILLGSRYDLLESLGFDYSDVKEGANELSFIQTSHEITQGNKSSKAMIRMLNLEMKLYFLPKFRIQPYILAGIGYSWLKFVDIIAESSNSYKDHQLKGLTLSAGLGLTLYFTPKISINSGFSWRSLNLGNVKNIDQWGSTTTYTEDELEGTVRTFDISIRYIF